MPNSAGRQVEVVLGRAVLDVQPLRSAASARHDHVEVNRRQAGRGVDFDLEGFAALVDRLVQPQQHVLAQRFAGQARPWSGPGCPCCPSPSAVRSSNCFGTQTCGALPPSISIGRWPEFALAEHFRLGRELELGQAGLVGLQCGQGLALGLLTQPETHLGLGGAAVGVDGGGENAVFHARAPAGRPRESG